MKKWATDSLVAWTLLAVGGGLAAQTVATNGQSQSAGKAATTTTTTTCPKETRHAAVTFNAGGTVTVSPSPYIFACAGDKIEWTFNNVSGVKKKALLNDPQDFLDDDSCKSLVRLKHGETKTRDCKVDKLALNGRHKYEIVGSKYVDPEVEVQGGVREPDNPAPAGSPAAAASPR